MKRILFVTSVLLILLAAAPDVPSADMARIHVVANSDSEADIAIKMKVADGVSELLKNEKFESLESIRKGLESRLGEIESECNRILGGLSAGYTASVSLDVRYFDKKSLGNSMFSEGEYLALVVTLGSGGGHNWWSVIFPDVSLEASLALGEEGSAGKSIVIGGESIVKIRCLIFDLYKFILTKA